MTVKPIRERILSALESNGGRMQYWHLAKAVFPQDQYPRAWGSPNRGGPPGCYMALSRAIDRHGFRIDYPDGAGGVVHSMVSIGQSIPPEIRTVTPALDVQPLTVQDAARVPEIAALIEARRRYIELVETYSAKLKHVEMLRLNGDWSQNVMIEFCEMGEAHRNFIAAAQTAADAALRAIAEGRA